MKSCQWWRQRGMGSECNLGLQSDAI